MATPTGADGIALASNDAVLAVDLGLVLAIDCSSSVDLGDFRLQMDGTAAALRNPAVLEAIKAGQLGMIALALVQWSSRLSQYMAMPWRIIAGAADLEMAAREIEVAERHWQPGGTGLAAGVAYCTALIQVLPCTAARRVIDVSGDGEDNDGGNPAAARDLAVALGITINGLPIVNGSQGLVRYYQQQVIGGPGAFLEPTKSIMTFRDTILRKLLREIGRPVS